ncbi:MAG TPA: hypothetical protein VKS82_23720 [Streptosporangiaceae bacterium]|nr:hypothetical protein [Streptosporangiaceae bacterium]
MTPPGAPADAGAGDAGYWKTQPPWCRHGPVWLRWALVLVTVLVATAVGGCLAIFGMFGLAAVSRTGEIGNILATIAFDTVMCSPVVVPVVIKVVRWRRRWYRGMAQR